MPMPELMQFDCSRGSPMGRRDIKDIPDDWDGKFFLQYVPFVDGCYDRGGAYWGSPANLFRAYAIAYFEETQEECETEIFVRANSREAAKALILEGYPNAKFYR